MLLVFESLGSDYHSSRQQTAVFCLLVFVGFVSADSRQQTIDNIQGHKQQVGSTVREIKWEGHHEVMIDERGS
jgi:hypothetical protein